MGEPMRPILLILTCLLPACVYNPVTDKWKFDPSIIQFETADEPSATEASIDHNLRVQRYMREHNGKMPEEGKYLPR